VDNNGSHRFAHAGNRELMVYYFSEWRSPVTARRIYAVHFKKLHIDFETVFTTDQRKLLSENILAN